MLFSAGARPDIPDARGTLPIHIASGKGYLGIIQMILSANPNAVNAQDKKGKTVFIFIQFIFLNNQSLKFIK